MALTELRAAQLLAKRHVGRIAPEDWNNLPALCGYLDEVAKLRAAFSKGSARREIRDLGDLSAIVRDILDDATITEPGAQRVAGEAVLRTLAQVFNLNVSAHATFPDLCREVIEHARGLSPRQSRRKRSSPGQRAEPHAPRTRAAPAVARSAPLFEDRPALVAPVQLASTTPPTRPELIEATDVPSLEPPRSEATDAPPLEPIEAEVTDAPPFEPIESEATRGPPLEPIESEATRAPPFEPIESEVTGTPPFEPIESEVTSAPPFEPIESEAADAPSLGHKAPEPPPYTLLQLQSELILARAAPALEAATAAFKQCELARDLWQRSPADRDLSENLRSALESIGSLVERAKDAVRAPRS